MQDKLNLEELLKTAKNLGRVCGGMEPIISFFEKEYRKHIFDEYNRMCNYIFHLSGAFKLKMGKPPTTLVLGRENFRIFKKEMELEEKEGYTMRSKPIDNYTLFGFKIEKSEEENLVSLK